MSQDIETKFLSRIKRKMGACQLGDLTGFNETTNMNGTIILANYQVQCSNGIMTENFEFHLVNGVPKLSQYNAQSPLLLVD